MRGCKGWAGRIGAALGLVLLCTPAMAKTVVHVGENVAWPPDSMIALAQAEHLVPQGYSMDVTVLSDPITAYSLLSAGKLDVLGATSDYIPVAASHKLPIAAVFSIDLSYGADQIVAQRGVTDRASIVGKRVAAPQAYMGELLMGLWLGHEGVSPSEVTWVDLNGPDAVGPMVSGQVAAAYLYEPWVGEVLKSAKNAHVVARSDEPLYLGSGMFSDATYMNKNFIAAHHDAALAAIKAHYLGVAYWQRHTAAANRFFAKFLKWPLKDVESVMGTNGKFERGGVYMFTFADAARYCGVLSGGTIPGGLTHGQWAKTAEKTGEWWARLGLLKAAPTSVADSMDCQLMGELVHAGFEKEVAAVASGTEAN